jgi:CheY-like chemotaxis protein
MAPDSLEHTEDAVKIVQPITAALPKRRALVVEADPAMLRCCRDILERSGFVVDAATSGIAAVVSARDRQPDLILMNLQLPDVPAREAVGWLRSNPALQSTPIIVLKATAADDADFAAAGPIAFLRKPISTLTIQSAIRQFLKQSSEQTSDSTQECAPCR